MLWICFWSTQFHINMLHIYSIKMKNESYNTLISLSRLWLEYSMYCKHNLKKISLNISLKRKLFLLLPVSTMNRRLQISLYYFAMVVGQLRLICSTSLAFHLDIRALQRKILTVSICFYSQGFHKCLPHTYIISHDTLKHTTLFIKTLPCKSYLIGLVS